MLEYNEEAIPERDPTYELPEDMEEESSQTMSEDDVRVWDWMVSCRPALKCIRSES